MNRTPIESKLLKSIGYENGVLEVEFASSGYVYRYEGVSQEQFDALSSAKSVGGHFLANLKPNFTGVRVTEPR